MKEYPPIRFPLKSSKKRFEMTGKFFLCHSRAGGNPEEKSWPWIPAFAGMTDVTRIVSFF